MPMLPKSGLLMGLAATLAIAASQGARAQDDRWSVLVAPYAWALSLDGEATIRGRSADVDVGFGDVLDDLDLAAMGEVRVHYGPLGVFLNGVYGKLSAARSAEIGPLEAEADATVETTFLEFGVSYRLDPVPLGADGGASVILEPYVGGRYTDLEVDLETTVLRTRDIEGSLDWTDPIVGLRTEWEFSDRWAAVLSGDIGGLGAGSDLAWNVIGVAGYRFGLREERDAAAFVGYRALGQDYDEGSGSDRTEWDVTAHGPVLGFAFRF